MIFKLGKRRRQVGVGWGGDDKEGEPCSQKLNDLMVFLCPRTQPTFPLGSWDMEAEGVKKEVELV